MNKIIIVDNHLLFREGIKLLVENEGFGEVIAEAENGMSFLNLLENFSPDLVIMDIDMPIMNGLEATKLAVERNPNLKILILTMLSDYVSTAEIRSVGAAGSVFKSSGKREFEKAFRLILSGEKYFQN